MLMGCSDLMEMSDSMQIYPNLPNQLIAICTGSGKYPLPVLGNLYLVHQS